MEKILIKKKYKKRNVIIFKKNNFKKVKTY